MLGLNRQIWVPTGNCWVQIRLLIAIKNEINILASVSWKCKLVLQSYNLTCILHVQHKHL